MADIKLAAKVTRVRAKERGYYGQIRNGPDDNANGKGDIFTIQEGEPIGSWMEVLPDPAATGSGTKKPNKSDLQAVCDKEGIAYTSSTTVPQLNDLIALAALKATCDENEIEYDDSATISDLEELIAANEDLT